MDKLKVLKKTAKPFSPDEANRVPKDDGRSLLTANESGEITTQRPQMPPSAFDSVSTPYYGNRSAPPPNFMPPPPHFYGPPPPGFYGPPPPMGFGPPPPFAYGPPPPMYGRPGPYMPRPAPPNQRPHHTELKPDAPAWVPTKPSSAPAAPAATAASTPTTTASTKTTPAATSKPSAKSKPTATAESAKPALGPAKQKPAAAASGPAKPSFAAVASAQAKASSAPAPAPAPAPVPAKPTPVPAAAAVAPATETAPAAAPVAASRPATAQKPKAKQHKIQPSTDVKTQPKADKPQPKQRMVIEDDEEEVPIKKVTPAAKPAQKQTSAAATPVESFSFTLEYTATERGDAKDKLAALFANMEVNSSSALSEIMSHGAQVAEARAIERCKAEEKAAVTAVEATPITLGEKIYSAMGLNPMLVERGQLSSSVGVPVGALMPTAVAQQRAEEQRLTKEFEEEMRREYEERMAEMRALWLKKNSVNQEGKATNSDPEYDATLALVRAAALAEGLEDVNLNNWQETGSEKERALREKALRDLYNSKVNALKKRAAEVGFAQAKQEYLASKNKTTETTQTKSKNARVKGENAFSLLMAGGDSDDE